MLPLLQVIEDATHCALDDDCYDEFCSHVMEWLHVVHPIVT